MRETSSGLFLDGGECGDILLPGRYIPPGTKPEALLDVFIYLDSEDRLVGTTETPLVMVGEFAFLNVISVNQRIGAFLDWGLAKDLLLPFREQEHPVRPRQRVLVGVVFDQTSQRIIASTRLSRLLNRQPATYTIGQPVQLLIISQTPLGYNCIVENAHRGLLYHTAGAATLETGQKIQDFVRKLRDDGKIDLSLDAAGYKKVAPLADQILAALKANQGRLAFDDATPPQTIRDTFGVSKNAFKLALGALYKQRRIRFAKPGIELVGKP